MKRQTASADEFLLDFLVVETPGMRALVRRGHEAGLAAILENAAAGRVGSVTGGRTDHPIIELPGGERIVLREYRRGGFFRHLNQSRYFRGHRAMEELRATERTRQAGVRTVEVIAAVERTERFGYTAAIATRWIPDGTDLAEWLRGRESADRSKALIETGRQFSLMHEAGVTHPDLNLRNVLVVPREEPLPHVFLLDFDRATAVSSGVPTRRRERDIRRFLRSGRKLAVTLGSMELRSLQSGYGPAWPPSILTV